jgi:hypothetical protein
MKPGHWLILGSAILGCTAALGIYLAAKGSPQGDRTPQAASPRQSVAAPAKKRFSISQSTGTQAARASVTTGSITKRESSLPAPDFRIHGKPPAGRVSDERAWFASAEKIGRKANHELEKLRETLDLSPNQQQRIFDALARNSPSWQPGMLTGGAYGVGVVSDGGKTTSPSSQTSSEPAVQLGENSTGAEAAPALAMNEEVMAVLDADQQQALMDEEMNRRAWWEEILPQLLPPELPTAAASPLVDDPAASLPGYGDSKTYQGPTELLEE